MATKTRGRFLIVCWDENTRKERGFDAAGRLVDPEHAQIYSTREEAKAAQQSFGGKVFEEDDYFDDYYE